MSRNSMLPMKTGGGILSKVIGALVALAVLTLVVKYPTEAAHSVGSLMHLAGRFIDGVAAFLRDLLG